MKKTVLILVLLFTLSASLSAANNVLYFNNIARPMGVGGAFTSVQDSLQAHLYNPAAVWFSDQGRTDFNISFDLIRGLYIFLVLLDASDGNLDKDGLYAVTFLSLLFSTANVSWSSDRWFFKINFLDQLITQGPEFPMYSTSATVAYKFKGPLTGFQTGITGHLYNIGSTSLPQGNSFSWGLFYRPGDRSPFSLGLFYFQASDDLPFIRRPFEQIMSRTFNFGAAYEFPGRFTLSFDLRNISNFGLDAYLQPHFGLEKIFIIGENDGLPMTVALRAGTYYDSETSEVGYSGGIDYRIYFGRNSFASGMRGLRNPGYFYFSYSFTKEENVPSLNRILRYNHILSFGISF